VLKGIQRQLEAGCAAVTFGEDLTVLPSSGVPSSTEDKEELLFPPLYIISLCPSLPRSSFGVKDELHMHPLFPKRYVITSV